VWCPCVDLPKKACKGPWVKVEWRC
jgi:hypothetical protein